MIFIVRQCRTIMEKTDDPFEVEKNPHDEKMD